MKRLTSKEKEQLQAVLERHSKVPRNRGAKEKFISFSQSFKRNLPLLVPIVPLIAAVQIDKDGRRIGEGWSGTKVISPM